MVAHRLAADTGAVVLAVVLAVVVLMGGHNLAVDMEATALMADLHPAGDTEAVHLVFLLEVRQVHLAVHTVNQTNLPRQAISLQ